MADQWTHIHIFLRSRMMGGTLFERCGCGRARSPVMTDHQSFRAEIAANASSAAALVGHFRRMYSASVMDMIPEASALARRLEWTPTDPPGHPLLVPRHITTTLRGAITHVDGVPVGGEHV